MPRLNSIKRPRATGLAGLGKKYLNVVERGNKTSQLFLEYYSLFKISSTFTEKLDMAATLKAIKKIIREVIPCSQFSLLLLDEAGSKLTLNSHFGFSERHAANEKYSPQTGVFYKILKTRRLIYTKNIAAARKQSNPLPGRPASGAFLSVPLLADGVKLIGVINLHRKMPDSFGRDEIALLRKIAAQSAMVIDRITLYQHHRELSMTDELTGIFNRRYFNQRYDREVQRAQRYERPLSVIMIDIDHFKVFNDKHGHLMGDRVLKGVADLLERSLRKSDILARFGGEEFVILLPEIDKERGRKVAEKLRRAIERANFPKGTTQPLGRITISLGLASFPEDSNRSPDLLDRADRALYTAKTLGRNQVAIAFHANGDGNKTRRPQALVNAGK